MAQYRFMYQDGTFSAYFPGAVALGPFVRDTGHNVYEVYDSTDIIEEVHFEVQGTDTTLKCELRMRGNAANVIVKLDQMYAPAFDAYPSRADALTSRGGVRWYPLLAGGATYDNYVVVDVPDRPSAGWREMLWNFFAGGGAPTLQLRVFVKKFA